MVEIETQTLMTSRDLGTGAPNREAGVRFKQTEEFLSEMSGVRIEEFSRGLTNQIRRI